MAQPPLNHPSLTAPSARPTELESLAAALPLSDALALPREETHLQHSLSEDQLGTLNTRL